MKTVLIFLGHIVSFCFHIIDPTVDSDRKPVSEETLITLGWIAIGIIALTIGSFLFMNFAR